MRMEGKATCGWYNSQNVYRAQIFLIAKEVLD